MDILNNVNVVYVCLISCIVIKGEQVTEINGTRGRDIDGPALIKLGRQLNKPFLTVIGMAITNLHQCSQWTQWSVCDARVVERFGIRRRTRKCGNTKTSDMLGDRDTNMESDLSICEGYCATHYNLTKNGFCMKLYVTVKNHDDAETQCQHDGGHLVNIDSDVKYGDVKSILTGFGPSIHIDGRRKDVNSPWDYSYGSQIESFNWHSGYPNSNANYRCLTLSGSSTRQFFNYDCTRTRPYICEIPA